MASALTGVSRFAFGFVTGRFVDLIKVSLAPAVVSAALASTFMYSYMSRLGKLFVDQNDPQALAELSGFWWQNLVFIVVSTYVYMWLIAKVVRLVLADEAPSLIGSGGTLRSAFWLMLYYIGAVLLIVLPTMLLVGIAFGGLFAAVGPDAKPAPGAILAFITIFLAVFVLIGWALCRFFVGFQPIALGERASFFGGWRLTRGVSWVLFFRVVAATIVFYALLLVFWSVVGVTAMVPIMLPEAGLGAASEAPSAEAMESMTWNMAAAQVVMIVFAMPYFWFLLALFAETYRRLSTGPRS